MSEHSHRVHEIPLPPPQRPVPLLARLAFLFGFILIVAVMVAFTPQIAKQIAYSWNIGVERAKLEVAQEFLADNPLAHSQQRVVLVAKAVAPSVVGVHVITSRSPEGSAAVRGGRGGVGMLVSDLGSGVIVDVPEGEGYILTNFHVIENALYIFVRLSDGREFEAEVIGRDRSADLAVLRIEADDLTAISWGNSRQVAVGEQVVAIGSPYGLSQTVTSGIISATERYSTTLTARAGRRGVRPIPQDFLQTDAAINPGNSGGPLVDMNGKLIGICTKIVTMNGGGNSGIGFAIPSFTAERIYEEIVSHGEVRHGWLGVELDTVSDFEARRMNQQRPKGAVVRNLFRGSTPAREAGLQNGDIILRWEETEITDPLQLSHLTVLTKPGTKVEVEVFRQGEWLTLEITIGTRPTDL